MDKVQIYYLSLLILGIFLSGLNHGKPKEGYHHVGIDFIAILMGLPIIGRIFLWW